MLEKGKVPDEDWKDKNKIKAIINECINIENSIKDINNINDKIKQCIDKKNLDIIFENKDEDLLNNIKNFGNLKEVYNELNNNKKKKMKMKK